MYIIYGIPGIFFILAGLFLIGLLMKGSKEIIAFGSSIIEHKFIVLIVFAMLNVLFVAMLYEFDILKKSKGKMSSKQTIKDVLYAIKSFLISACYNSPILFWLLLIVAPQCLKVKDFGDALSSVVWFIISGVVYLIAWGTGAYFFCDYMEKGDNNAVAATGILVLVACIPLGFIFNLCNISRYLEAIRLYLG